MSSSGKKPPRPHAPATKVVHSGRAPHDNYGFVNPPIYRGSTVLFPTVEKLWKRDQEYTYGRSSTPTVKALEQAIAEVEGGAATALTASGYQAVSTAIFAFVKSGDHILMVDSVYQPTRKFCDYMLAKLGVETTYYDPLIGAGIAELVRPNTRLIFTESPGSQTFEVQDIPAIARVAAERDLWLLMDNTWATPALFPPVRARRRRVDPGGDEIHRRPRRRDARRHHLQRARRQARRRGQGAARRLPRLGGDVSSACAACARLSTRLAQHQRAGLEIARWLEGRPEVSRVLHPGLPSHPQHALWKRDFLGASGLFSVVLKPASKDAVAAMLDGLKLFGMGFSWGGYESLVIPFDAKTYRTATKWEAEGPALRFHIGLEDVDDLRADLEAGFQRLNAAK